jgi:hypothetical protein
MRWLLPLVLVASACQAVPTPSGFRAPELKPGEVLVTGNDAVHWQWREPANYTFMIDSHAALISLGGQLTRVVVRDHERIEPAGDPVVTKARYPTFAEMQSRAEDALNGGAFVAVVLAADGHPTFIYIDDPQWFDDEFSASITDYAPS